MFVASFSESSYRKAEKPLSVQQGCNAEEAREAQLGTHYTSSILSDGKGHRIPYFYNRQTEKMNARKWKRPPLRRKSPPKVFLALYRDPDPGPSRGCRCSDLHSANGDFSRTQTIVLGTLMSCRDAGNTSPKSDKTTYTLDVRQNSTRLQQIEMPGCLYGPHFYRCDPSSSAWALKQSICEYMVSLKLKIN